MKRFRVCYQLSGSVEIEAWDEKEAEEKFDALEDAQVYENTGMTEITLIVEEE